MKRGVVGKPHQQVQMIWMPGKHALIRTRHAHANLCTTYLHLNSDTCTWTHTQTHSHTAGDQESGSSGRVDQRRRGRQYVRSVSLWYSLSFAWKLCHAVRQQLGREVTDSMCVCDLNCCEFSFNLASSADTQFRIHSIAKALYTSRTCSSIDLPLL